MQTRFFLNGVILALPISATSVVDGMAFGYLARQTGLTAAEAFAMSAIVCSGSAQFLALQMWSISGFTILAGTLLLNLRYLFLSATMYSRLRSLPAWKVICVLFFLYDENWILAMSGKHDEGQASFLLGSGLIIYIGWVFFTVVGFYLAVRWQANAALTAFVVIAIFSALLATTWKGKSDLLPWIVSALAALLASRYVSAAWYVLAGGLAGAACSLLLESQNRTLEPDHE